MEPTQFDILEEKVLLALTVIQTLKDKNNELESEIKKIPEQLENLELKVMVEEEKVMELKEEMVQKTKLNEEAQARIREYEQNINEKSILLKEKEEIIHQYENEFLERKANLTRAGEKIQSMITRLDEKNLEEFVA